MALNPTKTASNPRIAKLIELEVSGRIKPEHQQELDTYRAQGLAPPRAGGNLTESQSKSTGFYERAQGANSDFETSGVQDEPFNAVEQGLYNTLPTTVTNNFIGADRQKSLQAKEDFIRASLRYESGAAIAPSEFTGQDKTFFPQAGDSQEVIDQKARARRRVIDSLRVTAGPGTSGLHGPSVNAPSGSVQFNDQTPAQVANAVKLTPEQDAQFKALAQSGASPDQLAAYAKTLGLNVPRDQLEAGAKFYANPANRNIAPEVRVDNSVKPINPSDSRASVRGFADAATLGFSDELSAIGNTVANGGTYADNLNRARGIAAFDEQNTPWQRLGGQVVGGAVLPAGEARSVAQLAALGGGYGAAYGFGSADGGLGDRLTGAGIGGATGAAAGGAIGWLGNAAAARLGNRPPSGGGGAELLAAAGRQGVDVLPADVGGPMTRRFTSAAAQGPLSAGPIIRGGQRAAEQMQGARDRIAASVGNAVDPVEAGEVAQAGAQNYIRNSRAQTGRLYDAARDSAGNARPVAQRAIDTLDANLAELAETPETSRPVVSALEKLGGDLSDPNGLSIDGLRRLRTNVRGLASTDELRGTDFQRRAGQVLSAISDDIAEGLPTAEARARFRAADNAHRERIETIDEVIKPIVGGRNEKAFSPERVFQNLQNSTRSDTARLRRFVDTLQPDEANSIRATVIGQLGRASNGTQNDVGTAFSANQFLTHWNQLTPRAKDTLFRGEARDALNDLARIATGTREAQGYANRSNTGGAVLGNVGALFGIGSVSPTAAVAGGMGQLITGRLLASPRFARWLGRPARTPQEIANQARRLTTIAAREPAIANDILPIQQALQQALPNVAAEEQPQQRRR